MSNAQNPICNRMGSKYFMTNFKHNSYFNFSQECNATLHHILFLFVALDKISLCKHWHITSTNKHFALY